jgi:tRNA(fMet)-specific endonuclease VapC
MADFLLDTNAASALIKRRPFSLSDRFVEVIAAGSDVSLPAIALFELHYGLSKSARPDQTMTGINKLLSGAMTVLPFDRDDAAQAGAIRGALEARGQVIGPYDLLIAAQAVNRGLVLVTANTDEFSRVDHLKIENWEQAKP